MITLLFVVFSGNILNSASMPAAFIWYDLICDALFVKCSIPCARIQYLSPCAYAYKALMQNEFVGLTFQCGSDTVNGICFQTGEQVLDFYSLNFVTSKFEPADLFLTHLVWQSIMILWTLLVVFHLVHKMFFLFV
jgi:hypothetical protein